MAGSTWTSHVFFYFLFDTMLFILYFIKVSGLNPLGANNLCVGPVHTEFCSDFSWASSTLVGLIPGLVAL